MISQESLHSIGLKHGTDKATYHGYTRRYAEIMDPLRNTSQALLELGWGGYDDPDAGGESARMWREYAPEWTIVVADIYDKTPIDGIEFFQGSQDDRVFLEDLSQKFNGFDLIIDDASHVMQPTIDSFDILWRRLDPGGWYFIEDLGTSYLTEYGGDPDIGATGTVVHSLKSLVDSAILGSISEIRVSKGLAAIQKN